MIIFSTLFLFAVLFLANAVDQTCPDGLITIDFPGDTNERVLWPKEKGRLPPVFPRDFSCDFQIIVPYGYSVDIHLTLYNSTKEGSAPVQLIDNLTGIIDVYFAELAHYHFIADGGAVKLRTGQRDIRFRILLYWNEFPSLSSESIQRSVDDPLVYTIDSSRYPILVTADTRVSASIVVNPANDQDSRAILFFDGPNWNSTCLGTGYTLMKNKTQFVSTGNFMTIVAIGNAYFAYVVLQDYESTKDVVEFQGLDCYQGNDCGDFILDGTNSPAVLQSYNPSDMYYRSEIMDVITGIEGDAKLDVYIGGRMRNGKNAIASYLVNTTDLPQLFFGRFKTYVITGGKFKIHFSRILGDFQNQKIGGKGFISSFDYGHTSTNQDTYSEILAPKNSKIRIELRDIDFNAAGKLIITGYRNNSVVYAECINGLSIDMKSKKLSDYFHGDKMNVHYKTNPEKNDGFYMEFFVEKSSAVNLQMLIVILFLVLLWD